MWGTMCVKCVRISQEALAIYEDLGLKSLQLEALEALAAACKAGEKPSSIHCWLAV